uniref:Histone deacetylase 14 n=1 Tax=Panagrellus redivivus TaxID=6233 RepID=A0A7E4W9U9_PANRE
MVSSLPAATCPRPQVPLGEAYLPHPVTVARRVNHRANSKALSSAKMVEGLYTPPDIVPFLKNDSLQQG